MIRVLAAGVLMALPAEGVQDSRWNLGHDRAAVYDVVDAQSGQVQDPFWLLGCELEGRVGATDGRDLPYRYLFRFPEVKSGAAWEVDEVAFGDLPHVGDGVSPVRVVGACHSKRIEKDRVGEHLKLAGKKFKASKK